MAIVMQTDISEVAKATVLEQATAFAFNEHTQKCIFLYSRDLICGRRRFLHHNKELFCGVG